MNGNCLLICTFTFHCWYRRSTIPLRRFTSENITISLTVDDSTAHLNVSNIQTFTIWCEPARVFFSRLNLPTNVNIPPTGVGGQVLYAHSLANSCG